MYRLFLLCFVFLITFLSSQSAAEEIRTITALEAIEIALSNNLELKVLKAREEILKARIEMARVRKNPETELEMATDKYFFNEGERDFSLSFSQEFSSGGKRKYRIGVAEEELEALRIKIKDEMRVVSGKVKTAFLELLYLQERLKLIEADIEIKRQVVYSAEKRLRAGMISEIELNLSLNELRIGEIEKIKALQEINLAKKDFGLILGMSDNLDFELKGELICSAFSIPISEISDLAIKNRYDLNLYDNSLRMNELEEKLIKAERIPDPTVSLFYNRTSGSLDVQGAKASDLDKLSGIKVSFPIPLFDKKIGELRVNKQEKRVLELEQKALSHAISQEITSIYKNIGLSLEEIKRIKEVLIPTEENFSLIQKAYGFGKVDILQLFSAQDAYLRTRQLYLEALFRYNLNLSLIETAAGTNLQGGN